MRVFRSKQFEKSLKKILSAGKVRIAEVEATILLLLEEKPMPIKYRDHALNGEYAKYRECHIRPDVLLLYYIEGNRLVLVIADIGSHAQLFG